MRFYNGKRWQDPAGAGAGVPEGFQEGRKLGGKTIANAENCPLEVPEDPKKKEA